VLEDVERAVRAGAVAVDEPLPLEAALFTSMIDDVDLEEVTFTRATLLKYDEGAAQLAPEGRWQLSVNRSANGAIVTRSTRRATDGSYAVATRPRGKDTTLATVPFRPDGTAPDPTTHPTFGAAAAEDLRGTPVWSDLHWSELDLAAPARERRVVVSVQKAIEDGAGHFLGVVRVGLVTNRLDAIAQVPIHPRPGRGRGAHRAPGHGTEARRAASGSPHRPVRSHRHPRRRDPHGLRSTAAGDPGPPPVAP